MEDEKGQITKNAIISCLSVLAQRWQQGGKSLTEEATTNYLFIAVPSR